MNRLLAFSILFFASIAQATPAKWLTEHNVRRCMHGLPALKWSNAVAASAQSWANTCNWYHNSYRDGYGENLARGTSNYFSPERAAFLWYGEAKYYPYGVATPPRELMHFTQMVWKGTTEVGCGASQCGQWNMFVCRYNRPGNYLTRFAENVPRPVKTEAQCRE